MSIDLIPSGYDGVMNNLHDLSDRLDQDIWLFHLAFRQLVKVPDELLASRGLSRIHHRVLFVVGRAQHISVGDIAERLAISRQALHSPMRQLREASLITSKPSEMNRTVQLISLTPSGRELEQSLNELQRRHLQLAFSSNPDTAAKGWRCIMTALSQVSLDAHSTDGGQ